VLQTVQGSVYVASGLWPLLHYRSFEKVTGRKADAWLVKTIGALIAVVGVELLARQRRSERASSLLAGGVAAVLAAVDVTYASRGRIARIYLLDAVLESAFAIGWARDWFGRARQRGVA
jgi:hypothetical protein